MTIKEINIQSIHEVNNTSVLLFIIGIFGIKILYGETYSGAGTIMQMLIFYYLIFGVSNFYARVLDYHGEAWRRSLWFGSAILINIIMDYCMIPGLGAKGAALATMVSLVPYSIYTAIAVRKLFVKYR